MIEMKENLVETILDQAINIANIRDEDQLVSITNKIDEIDPVTFFENAKKTGKDRIFWSSTAANFYIVGVGNATEIQAENNRSEETEEVLNNILNKAIIHNPYQVAGTGIIALGGISFDPQKQRTSLWKNFKASQFTIPEFILTKNNEQYYYTMIKLIHKKDDSSKLLSEWMKNEKKLLEDSIVLPVNARVIEKEEI